MDKVFGFIFECLARDQKNIDRLYKIGRMQDAVNIGLWVIGSFAALKVCDLWKTVLIQQEQINAQQIQIEELREQKGE